MLLPRTILTIIYNGEKYFRIIKNIASVNLEANKHNKSKKLLKKGTVPFRTESNYEKFSRWVHSTK
jgi:hypothetical protein